MTYKATTLSFVKDDIQRGANYYKKISPRLAKLFLLKIREAKVQITENPFVNDVMYKDVRTHLIHKFPYHIHYLIDENNKHVVIIAVVFAKMEDLDYSNRK